MDENSYEIRIRVATQYVDDQSEPDVGRFVFAYTITIENSGDLPARLLSRHWVITDANGKVQEVSGDGVVGEQPHLNPTYLILKLRTFYAFLFQKWQAFLFDSF